MTQKKEEATQTEPNQKKKLISDRAAAMLKKIEAELAQEAETGTVPFRAKAVEEVMLSMRQITQTPKGIVPFTAKPSEEAILLMQPITETPKKEKEPKKP